MSDRSTLISQYEIGTQPYAWLFRICDLLGGLLLVWLVLNYHRTRLKHLPVVLLLIVGLGMVADPIFTTSCHVVGTECQTSLSVTSVIHTAETIVSASAIVLVSLYDAIRRKRLPSIGFIALQVAYGVLLVTQFATHARLDSLAQYIYQCVAIAWLAWFVRDYLYAQDNNPVSSVQGRKLAFFTLRDSCLANVEWNFGYRPQFERHTFVWGRPGPVLFRVIRRGWHNMALSSVS